ncbi:hypothetical protein [Bacillus safensis]|uniref:hypothetical protein n=1 Tax=Bacillus safensis TaxID=561879 RepID=UPI001CD77B4D|nr:hypothetical protein [Bacillus safensis]
MVNLIIQIISSMGTTIAAIFTAKAAIQAKKSNEIAISQLNKNRRVNIVLPFKKFEGFHHFIEIGLLALKIILRKMSLVFI